MVFLSTTNWQTCVQMCLWWMIDIVETDFLALELLLFNTGFVEFGRCFVKLRC